MKNIKTKLLFSGVFIVSFLTLLGMKLFENNSKLPLINGVILPQATSISDFSILDHNNQTFGNKQLLGRWHFISYGYTHCPDVCPTTLNALDKVISNLESKKQYEDLDVIFYSIDPQRDTVEHLSQYIPFFNQGFIGLTYIDTMQQSAKDFESSLSMMSILTPVEEITDKEIYGAYKVSHGVMLYLINPEGKLQAVLKPTKQKGGGQFFSAHQIMEDYLAIRRYFG